MDLSSDVRSVREFNRFYTRWVGALGEEHLDTRFSLTEIRLLYEIAHLERATAKAISAELRLDAGYVSRMVKRFRGEGLIASAADAGDGRVQVLSLTDAGWNVFAPLQERSRQAVAACIDALGEPGRARLLGAMRTIRALLGPPADASPAWILRPQRARDIGWVIEKQAEIYCDGLGWDAVFEATVARIGADFIDTFDPATHCGWIAEREGERVGAVFVVPHDADTAKLRMLVVDASARGLGIGRRLVEEAVRFARTAGYGAMTLWTFDALEAAGAIYEAVGFRCASTEPVRAFGKDMGEQIWHLEL